MRPLHQRQAYANAVMRRVRAKLQGEISSHAAALGRPCPYILPKHAVAAFRGLGIVNEASI